MQFIQKKAIAAAAIAMLSSGAVLAETIDFDEVTGSFQGTELFSSGSLTFAGTVGIHGVFTTEPFEDLLFSAVNAFNGTPYLLDGYGSQLTMVRTDLGAFTLDSFQMALGWYQVGTSATISVTYELAAGGQSVALLEINDSTFSTFTPGLAIKSATFDLTGAPEGYISMDNINISAVPEPGTWMMLVAGLAAVAAVARRQRH